MESFLIDSRRWGVVLPFLAIAKQQLEEEERGFIKDITVFGKCTHTKLSGRNSGKLVQGFFLFVIVFLHLAGRTCVRMYLGIFSFSIGVYINTLHTYLGVRIGSEKQMETNLSGCCTRILPICPLSVPNVVTYLRACTSEMHSAFSSLQP